MPPRSRRKRISTPVEVDEAAEIYREFTKLLAGPTEDGQRKRAAGAKPIWKVDRGHQAALVRHLGRYWNGDKADPDSGCHPLVHAAWRCLAIAYQEMHPDERAASGNVSADVV